MADAFKVIDLEWAAWLKPAGCEAAAQSIVDLFGPVCVREGRGCCVNVMSCVCRWRGGSASAAAAAGGGRSQQCVAQLLQLQQVQAPLAAGGW